MHKPELWAGMECTINRVADSYRDQLSDCGHYVRNGDLDRLANLNIKALRYPMLWEHYQPDENGPINWQRAQRDLAFLNERKIKPIVGLLHHGSGPRHTSLMAADFPEKFAQYARVVASTFPEVEHYTPVNEPLTTARFSGLYGFWYPHSKDDLSFATMLLNQAKATVLAMAAIREINPAAKLIQTEDLGKIQSSPALQYQADFENHRRWLTFDLLCGKMNESHPLWSYLVGVGISRRMLEFFLANPCPPDVMGLNYYVTSERFLDDNVEAYPGRAIGGNGVHRYVDIEAVRVGRLQGLGVLLREAWCRFKIPIAITEAHLACTREEQMRWLKDIWEDSCHAASEGIPVQAVTAWTTFGAYDWNSLLTVDAKVYEPGAFDVRGFVRPTALARMLRSIGADGHYDHPLLQRHGWWNPKTKTEKTSSFAATERPILILGKNGTLASAFGRICCERNISHVALSRTECDITSEEHLHRAIDRYKPWAVINTAGFVDVDQAESQMHECDRLNTLAPMLAVSICRAKGIRFMTFSSDLVFNGNKNLPYDEHDRMEPLNHYGSSKARGDAAVLLVDPSALIIRTSAFFGPWDKFNFAYRVLESLQRGREFPVVDDVIISPTYVPHLVQAALDLFIDEETGIWHIANDGSLSWATFAGELVEHKKLPKGLLRTKSLSDMKWKAQRPRYSVLTSAKGVKLPGLDRAIAEFIHQCKF